MKPLIENETDNAFDRTCEMFDQADSVLLSDYDPENGSVTGKPYDSRTGTSWSMSMISTIEEAVKCKYPLAVSDDDTELRAYLYTHRPRHG